MPPRPRTRSPLVKSVELAVRRQFNRWFRADREPLVVTDPYQAPGGPSIEAPGGPSNVLGISETARILVLRQDRLGDVLISTPIVRALRKHFPHAQIDALLSDNNMGARRAYEPFVNQFLRYRKSVGGILSLRSQMRARAYDVVVDMTDNASSTSSMLVTMSGARLAVGIDKENRGVYTHVVPRVDRNSMHIVDRIVRLLWPFGIDSSTVDKHMSYVITDEERTAAMRTLGASPAKIRIGVNISGSTLSRRMEAPTMIAFIEMARTKHPQVDFFVFTTRDLVDVQRAVCSAAGAHAVSVSPSFHAYACALSCMHALVTPDTAAVHLAAAWQMPSVVLYHPEVPAVHAWYPYDSYSVACETEQMSVAHIQAAEIATAIETMLNETGLVN